MSLVCQCPTSPKVTTVTTGQGRVSLRFTAWLQFHEDGEALRLLPHCLSVTLRFLFPTVPTCALAGRTPGQHLWLLTILTCVKACERGAEDFNKVAHASQVLVHVPEVGVDMVTIPETQ